MGRGIFARRILTRHRENMPPHWNDRTWEKGRPFSYNKKNKFKKVKEKEKLCV
jgi:hypothetical protein